MLNTIFAQNCAIIRNNFFLLKFQMDKEFKSVFRIRIILMRIRIRMRIRGSASVIMDPDPDSDADPDPDPDPTLLNVMQGYNL